ncbi:MAG TPA: hypothetical protein VFA56_03185 [Gaiellaceae bacterium]|nr:hypothetical protein [Gaiellaceae bacterium]
MPEPKLAVAVVADEWSSIRRLVDCLREQDAASQLELVVAAPAAASFELPELPELARTSVVALDSVDPLPAARAAAVRAAGAPYVFVAETHTLPRADWARATIAAHEQGAGVVVPAIGNGNPDDAVSWACLVIDYGRWLPSGARREVDEVPGYNTSYRRDALLGLGDDLDRILEQETGLAAELKRRGETIVFEPSARVDHLNISRRLPWIRDSFLAGRVLATMRIDRWSPARRAVYFAGSPLIPFVLLWRLREHLRSQPRLPLALAAVATAMAAGEMSGYAAPAGDAERRRMVDNELRREPLLAAAATRRSR